MLGAIGSIPRSVASTVTGLEAAAQAAQTVPALARGYEAAGFGVDAFEQNVRLVRNQPLTEGRWLPQGDRLARTQATPPVTGDRADGVRVATGTFSVASAGAHGAIQTPGIGPCVALSLFDPVSGVGALSHFHPSQDPARSVEAMLSAATAAGMDLSRAEARVIGGMSAGGSEELVQGTLAAVNRAGVRLVEADIGGWSARSVQLDLRTGAVSRYTETLNHGPVRPYDGEVAQFRRPR